MEALIGTIVGGVLAIFGGIIAKSFEEWRSRKSLRAAFRAEVCSIVEMFQSLGHERMFEETVIHWKNGGRGRPGLIGARIKPIDPVFSKNTDKIGLLGRDVAGQVVRFYAIMDGIREDLRALELGEIERFSQEAKIRLIEEDLKLWGEAKEIAAQLKSTL